MEGKFICHGFHEWKTFCFPCFHTFPQWLWHMYIRFFPQEWLFLRTDLHPHCPGHPHAVHGSQTITWTWHLCLKHWYTVRNSACLFNSWIHLSVLLFLNLFSSWFPSVKIIQNVFSYWLLDLTDRKRLQWITDLTSFSSQFRIGCCCSQLSCIFKAV